MLALEQQPSEVAGVLLKAGHDIDFSLLDEDKNSALMVACRRNQIDFFCEEAITKITTQMTNAQNIDGWTALMFASHRGNCSIVHTLLSQFGADPNIQGEGQSAWTALTLAASANHLQVVEALLSKMKSNSESIADRIFEPNTPTWFGWTALMIASEHKHLEVVQALLDLGKVMDVNKTNCDFGSTALTLAVENGHVQVVRGLLAVKGINVDAQTKDGHTATDLAYMWNETDILSLLESQDGKRENKEDDLNECKICYNKYARGERNPWKMTCGHRLCSLCLLRSAMAKEAPECPFCRQVSAAAYEDHRGNTPLLAACFQGNAQAAEALLLLPTTDVNHLNHFGFSALMVVCMQDFASDVRRDLVRLLLAAPGICVNLRSMGGLTAMDFAEFYNREDVVSALHGHIQVHSDLMDAAAQGKLKRFQELRNEKHKVQVNLNSVHQRGHTVFDDCCSTRPS